jgi:D-galactose 1-dehydrogenase
MAYSIAVIGLGKIAHDQHLPCIAKNPDFRLAATVSSRSGVAGVPNFATPEALFASGLPLDCAALCMPPEPRLAIASKAMAAGLDLLLEKPATPTVSEMQAMAAQAAKAGRLLFTTWHSQYNAAVDAAQKLLAGRRVTRLLVSWKEDVRHWHPGQEWIWEPGGFGVFDPGSNAFSIVTRILPQPVFVAAAVLETPANKQTPIAGRIRFKFGDGSAADLAAELDWRQTGEQSWNIDVETADGLRLALRKGGTELSVNGVLRVAEPSQEYEGIYAHFARLLGSGTSHVDVAPLQLVNDCFMLGRRIDVAPFL